MSDLSPESAPKRTSANAFDSRSLASLIAEPGRRALGAANALAVEFAHTSELNQSNTVI